MEASMLRLFAASLLAVAAHLATLAPAAAEKRVALVIGNSAYENVPKLANPSNDASDMAAKLKTLGFEVVEGVDLGKRDMEKRIRAFAAALSGADVGLFYYAGHGLQVDQRNFLAPVDAQLKIESDLDFEAVELDLVLKNMVRNARTSIVFLDACRDNPLAANLAQAGRSIDIGRGLARVETPASMMIVYATDPGNIALDGTGRNSPFTAALLRHIDSEGASISDVMIAVRNDVLSETSGKQRPFESASLTGQFFFKPKPEESAGKSSTASDEIAALREQIAKLQADQGALLKSQQEQLALLQKKLAEETKAAEPPPQQSAAADPGTISRVVGVEPAKSGSAETAKTSASNEAPPNGTTAEAGTKIAATEATGVEEPASAPAKAEEAPLPESATREQLARDILVELNKLGCYFGAINGNWGARSKLALDRFNRHAKLDLTLDDPEQASLDALKDWKGANCPLQKAVPPRLKQRPVVVAPKKQIPPRKAVRAAPPKAPVQTVRPRSQPRDHGDDAVRELQRAFPSTAWPQ
jgi:uncharacterized caspase-like protein